MSHHGHCFCGTVQIEVTGTPGAMGYCHCSSLPKLKDFPAEMGGRARLFRSRPRR